jgi:hypothetical protein
MSAFFGCALLNKNEKKLDNAFAVRNCNNNFTIGIRIHFRHKFTAGLPDGKFLKPKISIWGNFGESCHESCCYILRPFGLLYGLLVYFMAVWYILWPFGILYGHLEYFVVIWYIHIFCGHLVHIFCGHLVHLFCGHLVYFPHFGMLYQEKSGNPVSKTFPLSYICM